MTQENCLVCSAEFEFDELKAQASSINSTHFKVCNACLNNCDPSEDYKQVRDIVSSYLWFAEAKCKFAEVETILADLKTYR
jgi:hypothetical protein